MAAVFAKALRLIAVLAKENKEAQEDFFYHIDALLEVAIVPSDLAMALKEVCINIMSYQLQLVCFSYFKMAILYRHS